MKISEVIVVEGKNDVLRVKMAVDAYVVSVSGQGITKETLKFLKQLSIKRGIIVLMDPDGPGEKIRSIISEQIPDAKHAFIDKKLALLNGDVGIENASVESIRNSLKTYLSNNVKTGNLVIEDLINFNLVFHNNSSDLRDKLSTYLNIGKCNGKTLLKELNMLNLTVKDLNDIMEKVNGK